MTGLLLTTGLLTIAPAHETGDANAPYCGI